ncbi:MAG: hypothetical protein HYU66_22140 [Armatimonadetes bacterium]|nr:hypothetical protein [Armatimonadota bacterium]
MVFAVYFALRMVLRQNHDYQLALGTSFLHNWPSLATAAFASDLAARVLAALGILDLVGWTVLVFLLWLALRAARPARVLAAWLLLQTACYALIDRLKPGELPSHYLYIATVPAMGLVAMGLVGLYRRRRQVLPGLALAVLLLGLGAAWVYGLRRIRQDERTHWQVAAETPPPSICTCGPGRPRAAARGGAGRATRSSATCR